MPKRMSARPMPKSKKSVNNHSDKKIKSFLGEESSSSAEGGSFHSADLEANQTDYGLDFTSSNIGTRPYGMQTLNDNAPVASSNLSTNRAKNVGGTPRRRKQKTPKQKNLAFLKSVKQLQLRTDYLIQKAPFARLVREILVSESTFANRLTFTALQALQESAELYLTTLFQDAYCCTLHRGRVTLNVKDIELTKYLRGRSDPGNR